MDDLQTAPSNNKIIMWAIVALVVIGIIILIVALVNSSQSSSSNGSSSGSNNNNTFNEDDDDNFNGRNRPTPDYSLNSIGEAARHADLASVEDFHVAGSKDDDNNHESHESNESHESPKNSNNNNKSEDVSLDLHSSSDGVLLNSDSNGVVVKEVVIDNSDFPTSLPSNDMIKVSEFTNAPGPSDSLLEMSELSPSELDIVNEFEKKGQSEEFQLSSPLLDTMNKSQNQETPAESHHMKILAPIFESKDVDKSELTIDNSVTNAASLSSDFSNPTDASVKKPTKKSKKNDNHAKGFAELANLGKNPYRK